MRKLNSELDQTDLRILRALAKIGYLRNVDLAKRVNLSPSACHQRVARLKRLGVLTGYSAEIDTRKISASIRVLTLIMLDVQDPREFRRFNDLLENAAWVVRAYRTSGDFDYAVESLAPDFESYRAMIEGILSNASIKQYQSRIMQELIKSAPDAEAIL